MRRSRTTRVTSGLGILGVIGATMLLGYVCLESVFFIFIGPSPTEILINAVGIQQSKKTLAAARALWDLRGVTDYQITTMNDGFTPADDLLCRPEDTLTIKNGQVVGALRLAECRDIYQQLTVARMFEAAERELTVADPFSTQVRISIDPDYGYIAALSITQYPQGGIFGNSGAHPVIIRFSHLVVLNDP